MVESLELFLVEPDDDFAFLMRKSLERVGHRVVVCRTAADALIVLGHGSFSLVILDQRLPDMTGVELMQALHREGINTPVLMVAGAGDEQLATQVLRAGALDYIVKDRALTFLADLPKRIKESVTRYRLQQSNQLLIEAIESARDGIMITDLQGAIQHVNSAVEKMFGYSRQELHGENPRKLKSGEHSKELFAELWRTILARTSWQGELVNKRKDGTLLDVSLTVSPIVDARGQLTHFVGIFRDISERKQMERQLFQAQKMQSVGTLAGGIAHEFNNLLAGISGYAALGVRDTAVPPAVHEFLEKISQLSDRAANLTKQLLAFARRPTLSRQPTSMAKLFRATAELVKRSLCIEVDVDILEQSPDQEDLVTLADANQLQQVLVNLALNARDALKEPSPIIFRLRHQTLNGDRPAFPQSVPAGDYVVLEVEDKGSGMSPDVLQQALDPFFTTKEIGQGTGLGLPVAFGIVHAHQGFLTIRTRVEKGTCVSLYLPRLAAGPAAETEEESQVLEPETVAGRTILVIDDEEAVLDIIRRFLEIAGHKVIPVTNTAAALETLANGSAVDMVIMDLMIPGEQGHQSFKAVRQQCSGPILLCTGLLQNEDAPILISEGAVDILRKPFKMTELWNAVSRAFAGG